MEMTQDHVLLDLDEQGHLPAEAIVACADGQLDLLSPLVLQHLDTCAGCSERVSAAAELSFSFDLALSPELERVEIAETLVASERRLPMTAVVAALLIAGLGILPTLLSAGNLDPRPLGQALSVTLRSLPQLLNAARSESSLLGTLAPFILTLLLMGLGTAIALRQTIATRNQNA